MIISHHYKYLFVEVPHTATTAISKALRDQCDGKKVLNKHSTYLEFLRRATREEKQYFVFGGVRNPLDVVVTEYSKYLTNHMDAFTSREQNGRWVTDEHASRFNHVQKNKSFPLFLKTFYDTTYNNWFLVGHRHFDAVVRFESIERDFQGALKKIGVCHPVTLPLVNKSKRQRDFWEFYDSADIQRHAIRVFGPFMKKWGYHFPGDWNAEDVSRKNQLSFRAKDAAGQVVARYFPHANQSKLIQRMRQFGDKIT